MRYIELERTGPRNQNNRWILGVLNSKLENWGIKSATLEKIKCRTVRDLAMLSEDELDYIPHLNRSTWGKCRRLLMATLHYGYDYDKTREILLSITPGSEKNYAMEAAIALAYKHHNHHASMCEDRVESAREEVERAKKQLVLQEGLMGDFLTVGAEIDASAKKASKEGKLGGAVMEAVERANAYIATRGR